jgi:hypothetical protein
MSIDACVFMINVANRFIRARVFYKYNMYFKKKRSKGRKILLRSERTEICNKEESEEV